MWRFRLVRTACPFTSSVRSFASSSSASPRPPSIASRMSALLASTTNSKTFPFSSSSSSSLSSSSSSFSSSSSSSSIASVSVSPSSSSSSSSPSTKTIASTISAAIASPFSFSILSTNSATSSFSSPSSSPFSPSSSLSSLSSSSPSSDKDVNPSIYSFPSSSSPSSSSTSISSPFSSSSSSPSPRSFQPDYYAQKSVSLDVDIYDWRHTRHSSAPMKAVSPSLSTSTSSETTVNTRPSALFSSPSSSYDDILSTSDMSASLSTSIPPSAPASSSFSAPLSDIPLDLSPFITSDPEPHLLFSKKHAIEHEAFTSTQRVTLAPGTLHHALETIVQGARYHSIFANALINNQFEEMIRQLFDAGEHWAVLIAFLHFAYLRRKEELFEQSVSKIDLECRKIEFFFAAGSVATSSTSSSPSSSSSRFPSSSSSSPSPSSSPSLSATALSSALLRFKPSIRCVNILVTSLVVVARDCVSARHRVRESTIETEEQKLWKAQAWSREIDRVGAAARLVWTLARGSIPLSQWTCEAFDNICFLSLFCNDVATGYEIERTKVEEANLPATNFLRSILFRVAIVKRYTPEIALDLIEKLQFIPSRRALWRVLNEFRTPESDPNIISEWIVERLEQWKKEVTREGAGESRDRTPFWQTPISPDELALVVAMLKENIAWRRAGRFKRYRERDQKMMES